MIVSNVVSVLSYSKQRHEKGTSTSTSASRSTFAFVTVNGWLKSQTTGQDPSEGAWMFLANPQCLDQKMTSSVHNQNNEATLRGSWSV